MKQLLLLVSQFKSLCSCFRCSSSEGNKICQIKNKCSSSQREYEVSSLEFCIIFFFRRDQQKILTFVSNEMIFELTRIKCTVLIKIKMTFFFFRNDIYHISTSSLFLASMVTSYEYFQFMKLSRISRRLIFTYNKHCYITRNLILINAEICENQST